MPEINISNEVGRDAVVTMESVRVPLRVRWLDGRNRQAQSIRVLKSTIDHDVNALMDGYESLDDLGQAIAAGDPEINLEMTGSFLNATSRVFIDKNQKLVHRIQQFDVIKAPDGTEKERRPREVPPQNVSNDMPLKWTGKFIKKSDVVHKFVFANKMQLMHINGLTYDFLFAMAKELEEKQSMMMLGGGPKANQPLILRRGSSPYRGFLEGRTRGDSYCLILHLSNMELKSPKAAEETSE